MNLKTAQTIRNLSEAQYFIAHSLRDLPAGTISNRAMNTLNWLGNQIDALRGESEQHPSPAPVAASEPTVIRSERVRSFTGSDATYTVNFYSDGSADCTCPDYLHHQRAIGGECKHINYARWGGE